MKLHYKGKYNLNPESLPHGEHMPGAFPFQEATDSKQMSIIVHKLSFAIMAVLTVLAISLRREYIVADTWQILLGCLASPLLYIPHEFLHAVCFKEDVYLYTNFSQGMLFVVGPETMSKKRFIFMSLLPNLVLGVVPYLIGMVYPQLLFLLAFGIISIGAGAGDYYNVYNAFVQMPKGARTYMYQFNSYWYMPQ